MTGVFTATSGTHIPSPRAARTATSSIRTAGATSMPPQAPPYLITEIELNELLDKLAPAIDAAVASCK
jgi:hypothetical protein